MNYLATATGDYNLLLYFVVSLVILLKNVSHRFCSCTKNLEVKISSFTTVYKQKKNILEMTVFEKK